MDRDDIVAGERLPQRGCALGGGVLADNRPARSGAMTQQRDGHGLQSWPQQFVRLVGGHRRPAPIQSAPAPN